MASPGGVLLADYPHDPLVIGKDFSYRDWYKGVSRKWQPYVALNFYEKSPAPEASLQYNHTYEGA